MDVVVKKIEDLVPYENNPRINDKASQAVANSIREFGFKVPIIIDANNVIVAGHTRLKAAEILELKEVPCVIADDLTEEQIKAFRLADNKVSEYAIWSTEALEQELAELTDFDMEELFGFGNEYVFKDFENIPMPDDLDDFFGEAEDSADKPQFTVTAHPATKEDKDMLIEFLDENGIPYKE